MLNQFTRFQQFETEKKSEKSKRKKRRQSDENALFYVLIRSLNFPMTTKPAFTSYNVEC